MKLLTGGKDISQLIEKITWSGDTSQVSRKINFTIAQNKKDTLFPDVSIDIGDEIIMQKTMFSAGSYLMRIRKAALKR